MAAARLRARLATLRAAGWTLVQAALAAGIAWLLVTEVVGHEQPFFGPISAITTLGLTAGRRGRRALEVAGGVTLGIAVGDLLVNLVGSGTWQLVVIVLLAMAIAVLLGGSPAIVTQTGVSAVLVVTLERPEGFAFDRTVDAAVGCGSALAMTYLLLPLNPLRLVRDAAEPVLRELAGTFEDVAAALEARDVEAATSALLRARQVDALARDFQDALAAGRETARASVSRRRAIGVLEVYVHGGVQLDLAVRNARVLARGALRAIEVGDNVPPAALASVRELAAAVRALEPWLRDPERAEAAREHAVAAARLANEVLDTTANLSVSVIVGTVRSVAVDLLRGTGLDREQAVALVRGEQGGGGGVRA